MKSRGLILIAVVIALAAAGYSFLSKKKAPPPVSYSVPVLAAKVVQKRMPVMIEAIGTVDAYNSVTMYSRIVGQLQKIHFKEGQDIRKGDLIFTIDPAPFREKLKNAEAKLTQDMAQFKYNEAEAKRYIYLFEKGAVAKSDYENKQTLAATSEALVKADMSDVDNARINLDFCFIKAPIDGRAGAYVTREGQMVKDNDTKLAVINQMVPIYVKFSVPEKQLPEIRKFLAAGPLKVEAYAPGFKDKASTGTLTFIDNTVDTATGMIMMKATFPNNDRTLWPGQFVNVAVQLKEEPDAIVVPSRAVQVGQTGNFAFIIKPDNKVEYRNIVVARAMGEEAVITDGIKAGETVVIDGQLKLKDGFPVEIKDSLTAGQNNVVDAAGTKAKQSEAK